MSALESAFNRLESRLQSLVEGSLARLFPAFIWQSELAHQLSEALHAGVQVNRGVLLAPDRFTLFLPGDQALFFEENPSLLSVLGEQLDQAALEAGYQFKTRPVLNAVPMPEEESHTVQVVAQFSQKQTGQTDYFVVEQAPAESLGAFLIVDGTSVFNLTDVVTNIGRLNENHLTIPDGRVSRRHAQIRLVQNRYMIFDLGSTGGTTVNGNRITQSALIPGDVISLAGVPLVFGMETDDHPMASTQQMIPYED